MLKHTLNNITILVDQSSYVSTVYKLLGFTITNISTAYAVCASIIVMCMFATTLRNLIYKVLNLAVLSVFVVALWAYLTDVTFIYVVYILTFVSAVVMLFLSVVLMLPSSAIAVTKRNFLFVLSTATASAPMADITTVITAGVYCCFTLVVVYLIAAFFSSRSSATFHYFNRPFTKTNLVITAEAGQELKHLQRFVTTHSFYIGNDLQTNAAMGYYKTAREEKIKAVTCFSKCKLQNEQSKFRSLEPQYKYDQERSLYYVTAVPNLLTSKRLGYLSTGCTVILTVLYEFINFYVRRLEPPIFLNFKLYRSILKPLKKFVGVDDNGLERCWYNSSGYRHPVGFLTEDGESVVFLSIYTPWWSPFQVFNIRRSKVCIAAYLHNILDGFKLHPGLLSKIIVSDNSSLLGRYAVNMFWFKIVDFIFNNVELPLSAGTKNKSSFSIFTKYRELSGFKLPKTVNFGYSTKSGLYTNVVSANNLTFIKNFIIFGFFNLVFIILNTVLYIITSLMTPACVELIVQIIGTLSIFFIAVPVGLSEHWSSLTYSFYLIDSGAALFSENLAAIQHGLYVGQPLLLLVSITSLLVALIGAPFFVARTNK